MNVDFIWRIIKTTLIILILVGAYGIYFGGYAWAIFYITGGLFFTLLILTLTFTIYNFITKKSLQGGIFYLLIHIGLIATLIPLLNLMVNELASDHKERVIVAFFGGMVTFFIVAILKFLGKYMIDEIKAGR